MDTRTPLTLLISLIILIPSFWWLERKLGGYAFGMTAAFLMGSLLLIVRISFDSWFPLACGVEIGLAVWLYRSRGHTYDLTI